jgi:hypothetical protein
MLNTRLWAICCAAGVVAAQGCADGYQTGAILKSGVNARNFLQSAAAPAEKTETTEAAVPPAAVPPTTARKIIYNAQVTLVVESVSDVGDALGRLLKEHGGYLAETNVVSYSQQHRQATWKARVPVDHFDVFLAAVTRLGELQSKNLDSQDVTQEYVDLEARIANKQEEEKRLLKHLADSTGKLEDILAVERELSRVRGEIEQMQGRLRYLANVTALSTVTITATELRDYTPPVSPSFGAQVARTFQGSVRELQSFGKAVILLFVAAIPWIPVAAVLALFLWSILRWRRSLRPAR